MKREVGRCSRRSLPIVPRAAPNNREASRREADKAKLARRQKRLREEALARQRLADRRELRRQDEAKEEDARKVQLMRDNLLWFRSEATATIAAPASPYLLSPFNLGRLTRTAC